MIRWSAALSFVLVLLAPAICAAQASESKLWIVAGAASTTVRGDCQTCEEDFPYRHGPGILFDGGYRVNPRMNVGGEVFWVPLETASGTLNTTHIDAVAQYRFWNTKGFFVKGGAGMAFIRNWVDALGPGAINSKALSVVVGAGWIFFPEKRVGFELFASQHAGALGDLKTAEADVPDVLGNYWSFGASIVFR